MGTTSGSMRGSAGGRYSAGMSLYSAHNGTIEGPLPLRYGYSSIYLYRLSTTNSVVLKIQHPRFWGKNTSLGEKYLEIDRLFCSSKRGIITLSNPVLEVERESRSKTNIPFG